MKNSLVDLNNHLFMQLERLNDEELSGDKLEVEIKRAESITNVAKAIIDNGALSLKVTLAAAGNLAEIQMPAMLELPAPKGKNQTQLLG